MTDNEQEKELDAVSELAIKAKDDPALMADLWDAVQKLVKLWAYRYSRREITERGTRNFDADDLIQAGYIALVDSVKRYAPDNCAFTTDLHFAIRNRFAEAAGRRGSKKRVDDFALSLDAAIDEEGETSFIDSLADPDAEFEDDIIAREALEKDCAAILAEIDKLPDKQRQALNLTVRDGLPATEAAKIMGCSDTMVKYHADNGAAAVRNTPTGQRIKADYYPEKHIGLTRFKTTFTSAVEWAVLWREERGYLKL